MRIYKCINCNAEVLCDNDRVIPEENGIFKMPGKYIEIGNDDCGISANVDEDAEEGAAAEGNESSKVRVIDIVHNNRLQQTSFDKPGYMAYIKGYMRNLVEKLRANNTSADEIAAFQSGAQAFVRAVVGSFDEWEFYYPDGGDEMDYETAMVIHVKWEGDDEAQLPIFHYFKAGLKAEKV